MEVAIDFYAKAYIHGSNGWIITARTESIWFWASIIYIIVYFSTNILISYRFQKTGLSQRERKQARLLTITATASLLTGLVIMTLTLIPKFDIPDVTPISGAIWSIGIFYAIVKYKLLSMNPAFIADNLFETIIDSVILADPEGFILSVNPETQRLLDYSQKDLKGTPLTKLFGSDRKSNSSNISELLNTCPVRNMESYIISSKGVNIPIILSVSECKDNFDGRIGFVLASKDVTAYKLAEEKIVSMNTLILYLL
jgi:diguanylate cyclase